MCKILGYKKKQNKTVGPIHPSEYMFIFLCYMLQFFSNYMAFSLTHPPAYNLKKPGAFRSAKALSVSFLNLSVLLCPYRILLILLLLLLFCGVSIFVLHKVRGVLFSCPFKLGPVHTHHACTHCLFAVFSSYLV